MTTEPDSNASSKSNPDSNPSVDDANFAGNFVHSLGHSVIQGPIDGVREIVNTISNKEVVPKIQLVDAPKKKEYGTPAWTGQQLGKGAGTFAMLLVLGRIFRVRI
jgi:hypothetical protein